MSRMGKNFRSGGSAAALAPADERGADAPAARTTGREPVDALTRDLHERLIGGGFARAAFSRLCRLNAPRLQAAIAQRLERDALPCDGHDVLAAALARLQRHYLRGGAADADSALLASIGGARGWFAALLELASRIVERRSRWMGASSLPRPGATPTADTPERLTGRRVRFEATGLRCWIGGLLLALPPGDRHLVLRARRSPADAGARLRAAADRLFDDVDRRVAAGTEVRDG